MSILINDASFSNKLFASCFASSVLPTPEGPKNINDPIGWVGFLKPALALCIASHNVFIA